jgi:hypothetical protein
MRARAQNSATTPCMTTAKPANQCKAEPHSVVPQIKALNTQTGLVGYVYFHFIAQYPTQSIPNRSRVPDGAGPSRKQLPTGDIGESLPSKAKKVKPEVKSKAISASAKLDFRGLSAKQDTVPSKPISRSKSACQVRPTPEVFVRPLNSGDVISSTVAQIHPVLASTSTKDPAILESTHLEQASDGSFKVPSLVAVTAELPHASGDAPRSMVMDNVERSDIDGPKVDPTQSGSVATYIPSRLVT